MKCTEYTSSRVSLRQRDSIIPCHQIVSSLEVKANDSNFYFPPARQHRVSIPSPIWHSEYDLSSHHVIKQRQDCATCANQLSAFHCITTAPADRAR